MEIFSRLISSPIPVVVICYANWCSSCRNVSSVLYQIKTYHGDDIRVIKIDVDKNRELVLNYSIQSVPTILIFKDGKQLWRQTGSISSNELNKIIELFKLNR